MQKSVDQRCVRQPEELRSENQSPEFCPNGERKLIVTREKMINLTTNLAAVFCVCQCAKFDQFLPARSHFDYKRPDIFVRIATFPSATFGPLFSFHCPLFVTKNNNLEWKSSRFAAVDRRSVADKQLHLNGVIHSAGVAQLVPRAQPENVVHSGMQRARFKPRAGNNIFFIFIVCD